MKDPHLPLLTGFNESCCSAIIMVEAAENREGDDPALALSLSLRSSFSWNSLFDPLVWTGLVEELNIFLRSNPHFLIRDRDCKYGEAFTRVAAGTALEVLKTPYRAPKANAICERFLGSVRRECLDHVLILGKGHLYRVIQEYVEFFNQARPRQGIEQNIPEGIGSQRIEEHRGKVIAFPALNGRITTTDARPGAVEASETLPDEVFG